MSLDFEKHGLTMACGTLAAQAKRKGHDTPDRMAAYVLETLQSLTLVEIRDMIAVVVAAQTACAGLPVSARPEAFAHEMRKRASR